jgi:hypothetical protein
MIINPVIVQLGATTTTWKIITIIYSQDFKILSVHSDTWGHITCTNIKINMTKWTWDYNCKIQKFNNRIYIGIHWRLMTKQFLWEQEKPNLEKPTSLLINNDIFLRSDTLKSENNPFTSYGW